jgi:hypothetical protein
MIVLTVCDVAGYVPLDFCKAHPALANAPWGGEMQPVVTTAPWHLLPFVRQKAADKVLAVFNMSAEAQRIGFSDGPFAGRYRAADPEQ